MIPSHRTVRGLQFVVPFSKLMYLCFMCALFSVSACLVRHEDIEREIEVCARVFNTRPFCLGNLGALQRKILDPTELRAKGDYTKQTVVDVVSQLMLTGQQHQRQKRYVMDQPIQYKKRDCPVM